MENRVGLKLILPITLLIMFSMIPRIEGSFPSEENGLVDGPSAPLIPEVYVILDSEEIRVDVEHQQTAQISGTIYAETPTGAPPTYVVHVLLHMETSYGYLLDMGEYALNKDIPDARFQTWLPMNEKMSPDEPILCTITGEWWVNNYNLNGEITPVHATIYPIPYCNIEFSPLTDVVLERGEWNDIQIYVENQGNTPTDVSFTATGSGNSEIEVLDDRQIVGSGEALAFIVRIKPEGRSTSGDITVSATGTVEGDISTASRNFKWTSDTGKYGPFTATELIIVITVGTLIILAAIVITIIVKRRKRRRYDF